MLIETCGRQWFTQSESVCEYMCVHVCIICVTNHCLTVKEKIINHNNIFLEQMRHFRFKTMRGMGGRGGGVCQKK